MALTTGLFGEDAGTVISGNRDVDDNTLTTVGRDVPQWLQTVVWNASENVAPLTVMLERKRPARKVYNRLYNHLEDDIMQQWVEVISFDTDGDGTGVTLGTAEASLLVAGQTLYNPRTFEVLKVDSVDSTTDVTLTRGFGSSDATTLVAADELYIMPMADTDNNTAPAAKSIEPAIYQNYCQIAKASVDISGRDLETKYVNGEELAYHTKKQLENFQLQKERAFLFGARNTSSPTATGGLKYYISTNLTNIGGSLTDATVNTELKKFHRRNQGQSSSNLVMFAGELCLDAFDSLGRAYMTTRPDDKVLGIAINRLRSSHGELAVAKHGQLAVQSDVAGYAFLVNLDKIEMVQFGSRGMKHFEHIETPGTDGRKDYFLSDFGVALKTEKSHSMLYGVTG